MFTYQHFVAKVHNNRTFVIKYFINLMLMMKKILLSLFVVLSVAFGAFAQNGQISGSVVDVNGAPIIGAAVTVDGTSIGTTSGADGSFSINAPANGTISVSYIGFETQSVAIAGKTKLTIVLAEDTTALDEVLVVAYGTAKKESFSGSATMLESDDLLKKPVSSIEQSIQGKVAGVQAMTASGQPGASTSFRIRGSGSLNASNEPLYVIDGVATTSTDYSVVADDNSSTSSIMSSINPNDIESITILKDAAAASLYGSRAANGVVIITTKRGKTGEGKLTFSASYGVSSAPDKFDLMNSADYYGVVFDDYYATALASGLTGSAAADSANQNTQGLLTWNPYNTTSPYDSNGNLKSDAYTVIDTDWQDVVLSPGTTQDYNVSFSGGNDKMNYFFSGGYFDQTGTSPTSRYTRYSGKASVDGNIKKWLKAGASTIVSYSTQNTEVAGSAGASPILNALKYPSAVPVYIVDTDGNYILDESGAKQYNYTNPVSLDFNPLATAYDDINFTKTYRAMVSLYAELSFTDNLKLKTTFSPDFVSLYETIYWDPEHGNGKSYGGRSERHQTYDLMTTSTTMLSYRTRTTDGKHGISAMAGFESWGSTYEYVLAQGTSLFGSMIELDAAANALSPSSTTTTEALLSYIANAEYDYNEKYYLSASFRRDGSSVFGADNKWGNFFSVGASWRLEQEDFIRDLGLFNSLKLRTSYGTSGNNAGVDEYQSLGLWNVDSSYLYGANSGAAHLQFANTELGWEKQAMFNIGVDYAILGGRVYGSLEYYNKTSDDLLFDWTLPASHGLTSVMMNAAKTKNSGVEFSIGADVISNSDFQWSVDFNITSSSDKILDLAGSDDIQKSSYAKIWSVGGSQYEFYMPTWVGVDPSNGDPLWSDGNGGTTNVYSSAVYEKQGKSTPDAYGGFTNTLSYKDFTFSFMFYYSIGGLTYDGVYATVMHDGNNAGTNLHVNALDAWTESNTDSDIPKYTNSNTNSSNALSSRFLYDATYLKLKNVNLSYNVPSKYLKQSDVISSAKLYINADNLFTIFGDDWNGYDDMDIYGVQGYSNYPSIPLSRTITVGVNLTF